MYSKLFEQSFIKDYLAANSRKDTEEVITSKGVSITFHQAGVIELIPDSINSDTCHLILSCSYVKSDTSHLQIIDSIISDIAIGFQTLKSRCLVILQPKSRSLNDDRVIDEHLNNIIEAFWRDTSKNQRRHVDISPNNHPSIYSTVAYSPKVRGAVRSSSLFSFIESSHIDAVVLNNAPTQTLSWQIAQTYDVDSIQIELPTDSYNTVRHNQGFELALRDLLSNEKSEHMPKKPKYFRVTRTIVKQHENFKFLFSESLANFTRFKHGEVFGMDDDKPLMAKNDGEAILYPDASVDIGESAAIMVFDVLPRIEEGQLVYD
ncbi:succinylglutamate desuccinylase/aspartoacylase domain-containing protein [Vibrio viridaestus]|nr:succinylglutamate desuccinylase/aspartoacylase family protein [Vibrio viridaestus]